MADFSQLQTSIEQTRDLLETRLQSLIEIDHEIYTGVPSISHSVVSGKNALLWTAVMLPYQWVPSTHRMACAFTEENIEELKRANPRLCNFVAIPTTIKGDVEYRVKHINSETTKVAKFSSTAAFARGEDMPCPVTITFEEVFEQKKVATTASGETGTPADGDDSRASAIRREPQKPSILARVIGTPFAVVTGSYWIPNMLVDDALDISENEEEEEEEDEDEESAEQGVTRKKPREKKKKDRNGKTKSSTSPTSDTSGRKEDEEEEFSSDHEDAPFADDLSDQAPPTKKAKTS
jgi:hypothetical protein